MSITLFKPYVNQSAIDRVVKVLSGTQLAEGPLVKEFEQAFGFNFGFKNVCAVNSGTAALELAYELAGVGIGDEVITPVLTCTATNLPILHRGATPVFADVNNDLVINALDIEHRITDKTKAIVYVHFGGYAGGLKEVQEIAAKHNLPVIEDAAQAVGLEKGTWGTSEFTCVSFQAIKTLTTGDGGAVICKSDVLHNKAKRLRWFGYDRDEKQRLGDTDLTEAGYKYHMNDISAAIGLGNLDWIKELMIRRNRVQSWYKESGLKLLVRNWLIILVDPKVNKIEKEFEKEGIHISGHHYRNDKYTVFGGIRNDLPNMDSLEGNYTLLPYHQDITQEDVEKVVSIVKRVI
ncbi:aminotransferase class V-fold PLP-dependent enzyme [Methanoculleus sp.]|jgi:dTDP-4-amino-4,6-dideoxygalactose transaminase|uniref:DegT/DnrJ/EryC1/StrS family aminotransferase n=1 Tax=Methanoculleus sp. TaxID=90427 RepID=UPI0025E11CDE|nr:aminotransferase class V-fold PLP-dependent enzyme [Methanoculleus sp.]MCK9319850.1 aminotransferase class V-fold PLP-dependent enzyme [Methanoculleus sp.]